MTLRDTLAALAGDTKPSDLAVTLVELRLQKDGSSLDELITHDAAALLHLLDRREFAENAVRARLPEMWRGSV